MIQRLLRSWFVSRGVLVTLFLSVLPAYAFAAETAPDYLVAKNISYGDPQARDSEFQMLDVYWKDSNAKRPVIIYVHGGGWAFGDKSDVNLKPEFFSLHEISFISMNYRLRWEYDLFSQLEDIASVVAWVKQHHAEYGLDPEKIVLMGHGAGAHLVSLVGTDDQILKTKGLSLADIRAVVAIDTPSFDIPLLMNEGGNFLEQRRHRLIFGEDVSVWKAASPITHVEAGKGVPSFAVLYVADSESTSVQARSFSKVLRAAGVNVIMIPGNEKTTDTIDEELGRPGDTPTLALVAFLRATI